MTARGVTAPALDPRVGEIARIVESPSLHGSESLCKLLRYLANRAIHEPGSPIREHEIAADVFGRSDFDPRIDSTVRVNVARLRTKLIEHYTGPGAGSPTAVELPKGSYSLVFQNRPATIAAPAIETASLERTVSKPELIATAIPETRSERPNRLLVIALVSMTAIAAMLATTLMFDGRGRPDRITPVAIQEMPSIRRFWGMLLNTSNEPWVVFSNAAFVGRPSSGMRYMVPSRDSGREVLDFYTGTGEVLGVYALDRMFTRLNRSIRVKRGGLLSLDDVENNDVIFVGSPLENLTLREVPGLRDFAFKLIESGPKAGEGSLVNVAPRSGEPAVFEPSPLPLTRDFAVIALVPGLNPSRWALILAGTSTIGTQGAVEYVCREDTVSELLGRLKDTTPGARPFFEAVLQVDITAGVPVRSSIVAFHERRSANAQQPAGLK